MNLEIVIPSLNRKAKLLNLLRSIEISKQNYSIKVYLYFSLLDDLEDIKKIIDRDWIEFRNVIDYRVPFFWNNHLKQMNWGDALCYINDDVEFLEDTIEKIYLNFQFHFPDKDGLLGIKQINIPEYQSIKSAFGVIGKKFAERFPDKQVFCLDYYRFFADTELGMFATKINKFQYCSDCRIKHYHPSFSGNEDSTHNFVRRFLNKDRNTFKQRQQKGLLWGESFKTLES